MRRMSSWHSATCAAVSFDVSCPEAVSTAADPSENRIPASDSDAPDVTSSPGVLSYVVPSAPRLRKILQRAAPFY